MKKILLGLFLLFSGLSYAQTSNDVDAEAFITACDADPAGKLTYIQKVYITQLVEGLKSIGVWSKCKAIYPFVGGTAFKHKFNLKDPRDLDAAFRLVFFNSPTHSANGVQFDGINDYANTFFNPSTNLSVTSTHVGVYVRTSAVSTTNFPYIFGVSNNSVLTTEPLFALALRNQESSTLKAFASTNSTTNDVAINTSFGLTPVLGFTLGNCFGGNLSLNNKGENITNSFSSNISSTLPNGNATIGTFFDINTNSPGSASYDNKQINYLSVGDGLTDTQIIQLSHLVTYSQTTLQRQ